MNTFWTLETSPEFDHILLYNTNNLN